MKLQEAIDKRYSVREFEPKKVPKEIIKKLIVNASKAPSAGNWQPWEFYVIDSEKKIKQISNLNGTLLIKQKKDVDKLEKNIRKVALNFYKTLGNCKTIILIYMKKEDNKDYRLSKILSISAAIENLMLSALEYNLGTCWIGSLKKVEKEINHLLKIKNKELIAGILIGYPKKNYKTLIREKKKLNEILKFI
jgi:nitroreductase